MNQNDKKCVSLHISGTIPHMIVVFHAQFFFFKILIFWVFRGVGVKGQKMVHNYQFQSVTLYILKTVDHIINIFGTQV